MLAILPDSLVNGTADDGIVDWAHRQGDHFRRVPGKVSAVTVKVKLLQH